MLNETMYKKTKEYKTTFGKDFAEKIVIEIIKNNQAIDWVKKSTDFEDQKLKVDFWIKLKLYEYPIGVQLTLTGDLNKLSAKKKSLKQWVENEEFKKKCPLVFLDLDLKEITIPFYIYLENNGIRERDLNKLKNQVDYKAISDLVSKKTKDSIVYQIIKEINEKYPTIVNQIVNKQEKYIN